MINQQDVEKYKLYLKYVDEKLKTFFTEQSPYIFCKEGCSHCCKNGEYPMSELEFLYMISGIVHLPFEIIVEIEKRIFELKKEKDLHENSEKFHHACPFLHKNKCSVYQNRPIICRTHGLAFFSQNKHLLVPNCVSLGLNYSNVYDFNSQSISTEKYKKLAISQEPLAHNVGLAFMLDNETTAELGLNFGEIKPLSEWLFAYLEELYKTPDTDKQSE